MQRISSKNIWLVGMVVCDMVLQAMYLTEAFSTTSDIDYCNIPSCGFLPHIMCDSDYLNHLCQKIYLTGFTGVEVDYVLHLHNVLRNELAIGKFSSCSNETLPPAAAMMELSWSVELQHFAQTWVDHCIANFGRCMNTPDMVVYKLRFLIVNSTSTTPIIWKRYIDSYKRKASNITKDVVENTTLFNGEDGILTMLWSNTTKMGCGYTRGLSKKVKGLVLDFLHCSYGPRKPNSEEKLYEIGKPCSKCPSHMVCKPNQPGLCSEGQRMSANLVILTIAVFSHLLT